MDTSIQTYICLIDINIYICTYICTLQICTYIGVRTNGYNVGCMSAPGTFCMICMYCPSCMVIWWWLGLGLGLCVWYVCIVRRVLHIYICVYIYTYIYVYIYARIHVYVYVYVCLSIGTYVLSVLYYFLMGGMFWLSIVGLFCYICIFYDLYGDSLTYAFGWSAFLCRIRFCYTLVVIFSSKHHDHHYYGDLIMMIFIQINYNEWCYRTFFLYANIDQPKRHKRKELSMIIKKKWQQMIPKQNKNEYDDMIIMMIKMMIKMMIIWWWWWW
jgi:hypothetical protein